MKTVIIEDEPLVARDLQNLILSIDTGIEILATLDSIKSCVTYFLENPEPDLVFMDVQLSDGVSFDLFNQINLSCPIIFTTAFDEYALRAFKLNSVDYLLKPIDKEDLKKALEKFEKSRYPENFDFKSQIQTLIQQISNKDQAAYKERFIVRSGASYLIVEHTDIAYFLKDSLIFAVTKDNQQYMTDFQTMEELEEVLNNTKFYRANRQTVINIAYVEGFKADVYGKLVARLKSPCDLEVDISREKAQAFKKWLQ